MLDVHPPHSPTHTWKDFFIHIATIVIGLLIAVGLEQLVEYIHHRRQLAETRVALAVERRINENRFAVTTEQFRRIVPILERNLSVFIALKGHVSHAGPLPELDWHYIHLAMMDGAWQTAKQDNVLAGMPAAEARDDGDLYRLLKGVNDDIEAENRATVEATLYQVTDPNPAHLSVQQLDRQVELTARLLQTYRTVAIDQANLGNQFPDFSQKPTREEVYAIPHQTVSPEWIAYATQVLKSAHDFDIAQTAEASPSK